MNCLSKKEKGQTQSQDNRNSMTQQREHEEVTSQSLHDRLGLWQVVFSFSPGYKMRKWA